MPEGQKTQEYYEQFKIADFRYWTVYLHEQQGYLGRVYIWARQQGDRDMTRMTSGERQELFELALPKTKKVLENLFQPDLFNFAQMGNEVRHLHFHVIPRYASPREAYGTVFEDQNWGHNYAPYRKTKFPRSLLFEIRDELRKKF